MTNGGQTVRRGTGTSSGDIRRSSSGSNVSRRVVGTRAGSERPGTRTVQLLHGDLLTRVPAVRAITHITAV